MLQRHLLDEGFGKADVAVQIGVTRGLIHHLLSTGKLDDARVLPGTPLMQAPTASRPVAQ